VVLGEAEGAKPAVVLAKFGAVAQIEAGHSGEWLRFA
jgi:hypothetical protein